MRRHRRLLRGFLSTRVPPTTEPLRILRLITRLNVGGPARQAVLLQEQLPALGFETLLLHGHPGDGEASLTWTAPPVVAGETRLVPKLGRALSMFDDFQAFVAITRAMFTFKPDIVHTHMAKAGTLGRLAASCYNLLQPKARRCLVVHTFHGHVFHGYFGRLGSRLTVFAERGLALLTDRIIAISPSQALELTSRYHIARDSKIRIVPLGFELGTLLALPLPQPGEHLRCIFVGRLVPIKDLPTLMTGFAWACRTHSLTLRIVGDGPARPELERLAAALGIEDKVTFTGWCRDLNEVYGGADVVLLSSLNEGTPVAVIEALAAARAVIATSVGGVPDVIQDGKTGRLVPPRSPEAFAAALDELSRDPSRRIRMGAAGRNAVKDRYDVHQLVASLGALYRQDVAGKRGHPASTAVEW